MALDKTKLNPGGSPGGRGDSPVLWTYASTADALATIAASGYFNDIAYMLTSGDVIYVNASDGSAWYEVTSSAGVVTSAPIGADTFILTGQITDISTAGQVYIVSPVAAEVVSVSSVINTAITTADATLTVKTAAGTVGTITVAYSGSAPGDVDTLAASSNTAVAAGATVEIETDGGSSTASVAQITVLMRRT
jgi:hypothetical protein